MRKNDLTTKRLKGRKSSSIGCPPRSSLLSRSKVLAEEEVAVVAAEEEEVAADAEEAAAIGEGNGRRTKKVSRSLHSVAISRKIIIPFLHRELLPLP